MTPRHRHDSRPWRSWRCGARRVALRDSVRLIDLRGGELERLGIARSALTATPGGPLPLHGRAIGGQRTHGYVWHSRQASCMPGRWPTGPPWQTFSTTTRRRLRSCGPHRHPHTAVRRPRRTWPLDIGPGRAYVADLTALLDIVTM